MEDKITELYRQFNGWLFEVTKDDNITDADLEQLYARIIKRLNSDIKIWERMKEDSE